MNRKGVFAASIMAAGLVHSAPGVLTADVSYTQNGEHIIQWVTENPDMRVDVFAVNPGSGERYLLADDETGSQVRIRLPEEISDDSRFYVVVDGGPKDPKEDGYYAHPRALSLKSGSNFRDSGGYVSKSGDRVKWGKIYRSGAPVVLIEEDLDTLDGLGIRYSVDLRSMEERELSPSQLAGPAREVLAFDYSIQAMLPDTGEEVEFTQPRSGGYGESILVELAPAYQLVFKKLLKGDGAVHYHCSAGQDRTGLVTALILAALDVPREQIIQDYHLSTPLRNRGHEVQRFDPADYPDNLLIKLFTKAKESGVSGPQPLYGEDGISILAATLDMIDSKWGSVGGYLEEVIGLTDQDMARLQSLYLE